MLPSTLLMGLVAFSSAVFAQPTDMKRSTDGAAAVEAPRAVPNHHHHRSHAHAVRRAESNLKKRSPSSRKKRCKAVPTTSGAVVAASTLSESTKTHTKTVTSTSSSALATSTDNGSSGSGSGSGSGTNSTSSGGGPAGGVITVQDSKCGPNGAVSKTTETAGPNGALLWMDCGITKGGNGGWTPPMVTLNDLVTITLDQAMAMNNSPFTACSKYIPIFKSVAASENIPEMMLASFAMQESSCNPQETGGGGETGMFQLSQDKCPGGKASSACFDPETNTKIAASYIKSQIAAANNNIFTMVGEYNGWNPGMTYDDATKAASSSCCRCQNNLDYLHQFFNGWMLGIDAYSTKMGVFFNLDQCPNDGANGKRDEVPRTMQKFTRPEGGWRF